MCRMQCVLSLLALCVGLTHSFSWDIVLGRSNGLDFYNNRILTHSVEPSTFGIKWITYDPEHNRVIFDVQNDLDILVASFNIETKKTEYFIKNWPNGYLYSIVYDPVSELLFGIISVGGAVNGPPGIYSYSLKPGSNDVSGNLVINMADDKWVHDIAVDSCGGYIYWILMRSKIERARINGTEREVVQNSTNKIRQGLTIGAQKMYWIEIQDFNAMPYSIEMADLNGKNRKTLLAYSDHDKPAPEHLTVSNDNIYWADNGNWYFWQNPKNPPRDTYAKPKPMSMIDKAHNIYEDIAINYNIKDECAQGNTGERCGASVCQNYCFQGDCSVSAEGQPDCRCKAGYSGDRCEAIACHKYCLNNGVCSINEESEEVCHCTEDYEGERCDVPVFLTKCFRTVSMLKDILTTNMAPVTLGKGVEPSCVSSVV